MNYQCRPVYIFFVALKSNVHSDTGRDRRMECWKNLLRYHFLHLRSVISSKTLLQEKVLLQKCRFMDIELKTFKQALSGSCEAHLQFRGLLLAPIIRLMEILWRVCSHQRIMPQLVCPADFRMKSSDIKFYLNASIMSSQECDSFRRDLYICSLLHPHQRLPLLCFVPLDYHLWLEAKGDNQVGGCCLFSISFGKRSKCSQT